MVGEGEWVCLGPECRSHRHPPSCAFPGAEFKQKLMHTQIHVCGHMMHTHHMGLLKHVPTTKNLCVSHMWVRNLGKPVCRTACDHMDTERPLGQHHPRSQF